MGTFKLELRSWPKTRFTAKAKTKFYTARGSNDCQTFEWMNSIKFKASLCQTLDVSNSERMHSYLRYDFADRKI